MDKSQGLRQWVREKMSRRHRTPEEEGEYTPEDRLIDRVDKAKQSLLDKGATEEEADAVVGRPGATRELERTLRVRKAKEKEAGQLAAEGIELQPSKIETVRTPVVVKGQVVRDPSTGDIVYETVTKTKPGETPAEALARVSKGRREALEAKRALRKEKFKPYLETAQAVRGVGKFVAGEVTKGTTRAAVRATRGTRLERAVPRVAPRVGPAVSSKLPVDLSYLREGGLGALRGAMFSGGGLPTGLGELRIPTGIGTPRMDLGMGFGPSLLLPGSATPSPLPPGWTVTMGLAYAAAKTNGEAGVPNTLEGIATEAGVPEVMASKALTKLRNLGRVEKVGTGKEAIFTPKETASPRIKKAGRRK